MIDKKFWTGKRVFLTGHTGFKGSWLSIWLSHLDSVTAGFSLPPPTNPSLFESASISKLLNSTFGDIRDLKKLKDSMITHKPEILFHLAAQPLVRESYDDPITTLTSNIIGTANVLEAARQTPSLRAIVIITTDKCYRNNEWVWGYRETDSLGGHDPYSCSKACAELVSSSYRDSFFSSKEIGIATARAGNVIGGGDWAVDRIIPDCIRALEKNNPVIVRNPQAIRPWQHVLEPLSGYLLLAQNLFREPRKYSEAWNFGPDDSDSRPVEFLVKSICEHWQNSAGYRIHSDPKAPHEARNLTLDCSKAKSILGWHPVMKLEESLGLTGKWYFETANGKDPCKLCLEDIEYYNQATTKIYNNLLN